MEIEGDSSNEMPQAVDSANGIPVISTKLCGVAQRKSRRMIGVRSRYHNSLSQPIYVIHFYYGMAQSGSASAP